MPETWKSDLGDWYVERGAWEIGTPTVGPRSCYSPPYCAGTVLKGNYHDNSSTRLICPTFKMPSQTDRPSLRFIHWYDFASGDAGYVQIKIGKRDWQNILGPYVNNSGGVWTQPYYDLSAFADSTVQIAFLLSSNCCQISTGWYIDDIVVTTVTSIDEHSSERNANELFSLHPNYPNPFNPTTIIRYQLPASSEVQLIIYNTLGQNIRTLVNNKQNAGNYSVQWDGRDNSDNEMANGVYLYQLRAGEFSETRRLALMR